MFNALAIATYLPPQQRLVQPAAVLLLLFLSLTCEIVSLLVLLLAKRELVVSNERR